MRRSKLVAADDEMRNLFYSELVKLHQESRFPRHFRTQEAFAGRFRHGAVAGVPDGIEPAPDKIELMKVVDVDTGPPDGVISVYLFRFRTLGDHWAAKDGWMAGVAGGYRKADQPTTLAQGQTFSTFKKYDAQPPEKHVEEITRIIKEAWKREASNRVARKTEANRRVAEVAENWVRSGDCAMP